MGNDTFRGWQNTAFENHAELLVALQLDLLAQIEGQLRSVHRTMHRIEKLRNVQQRTGPELSIGQKEEVLFGLKDELDALEAQLTVQHSTGGEMQSAVAKMQEILISVKEIAKNQVNTSRPPEDDERPNPQE